MKTSSFELLLLSMLLAASAGAQNVCSQSITACGCTITTRGNYVVNANLSGAQGLTALGGCIDINAAHVKLFLNGYNVSGKVLVPVAIGVHVLPAARYTFIEESNPAKPSGNSNMVTAWTYGIESDADNVIIDMPNVLGNDVGVFLNKTYNDRIVGQVDGFGASFNHQYGIWIVGGNSNQVHASFSEYNGIAGIYVGCSVTGPGGTPCPPAEASTGNVIYSSISVDLEAVATQPYGIVLERNSVRNTVMGNESALHPQFDMFDGNSNCADNLWLANSVPTTNQSCIH